jgi:hypothetical protein
MPDSVANCAFGAGAGGALAHYAHFCLRRATIALILSWGHRPPEFPG